MARTSILRAAWLGTALIGISISGGCASTYYGALAQFGYEKRDILVDRVAEVMGAQQEAKEEFSDALEAFRAMVNVDGGELEKLYDRLNGQYKDSEEKAAKVRDRIGGVKSVSKSLFAEWESELSQYSDPGLRKASEAQLDDTRARYAVLVSKMDAASASMDPVLSVFKDRVLFLKHNLNARAISALDGESAGLEADVANLIAEMERSIAEADAFIKDMRSGA